MSREPVPRESTPTGPAAPRRFHERMFYDTLWVLCRTLGVALFGIRFRFAEPLPTTGGLLVLSTHQSLLDPLLIGLVSPRRLASLARSSLFRWGPFGAIISALDAVPIDREASAVAAMKTVIRKLQGGAAVVIYPEGTRTTDGRLGEVKSGFALIAKRAGVPIMPVAIVGAWECWPRGRPFPLPGRVRLEFGALIPAAAIAAMDDATLVAEVARRLAALDSEARRVRAGIKLEPSPRRKALESARSAATRRVETGARPMDPVAEAPPPAERALLPPSPHEQGPLPSPAPQEPAAEALRGGVETAEPEAGMPPSRPV